MGRLLTAVIVLLLVAALGYVFLGGHYSADDAEATLELVRIEGMARAGYSDLAPLAYADATRGLTGEAPEIARVIFGQLGVRRVEGVLTPPAELISDLYARRFELIASGMEITPQRCRQLVFSVPTHAVSEAFLVRHGNPLGIHSYEDAAKNPKAFLGVVTGSSQHNLAIVSGIPASRIRLLSAPGSGVASLITGVIDAFASDSLSAQRLVDASPQDGVERATPFQGPVVDGHELKHYGAFAFRERDVGLAREFNTRLRKFIGTPEHLALVRPFGITPADLPDKGVTAKMICRYGHPVSPEELASLR